MKERKFTAEFTAIDKPIEITQTSDYNEFQNKELLDKLRNNIIQHLIDSEILNNKIDDFIKNGIDEIIRIGNLFLLKIIYRY